MNNYKIKHDAVILGIESSCDETACAIIKGRKVLADCVISSAEEQALYGGVVPEIASRAHTDVVDEVVYRAMNEAGITPQDVDAVAVTYGAGLLGALLVGLSFAKSFAHAMNIPLIAVDHIRGHMAAAYLEDTELKPPFITLLASGEDTLQFCTRRACLKPRFWAAPATTPQAKLSTRLQGCWGFPIPAVPACRSLPKAE